MSAARRLTIGVDASRGDVARPTGTERYSREIVAGLVEVGPQHAWRLYRRAPLAMTAARAADPARDVVDVIIPAPRLWTHTRLLAEVRRRPPDVLFVPAHVMPWWTPCPTVVTVHDLGHLHHPQAHTWTQRAYLDLTTRRHAAKAAHLIADSTSTAVDLERAFGVEPGRITVVPLGVDGRFAPSGRAAVDAMRRRLGLSPATGYLLHVGTLQPRKNLLRLIEAFARVAAGRPELELVLAGSPGWGGEDYLGRARALGVGDRVRLIGYVDEAELPALYSGALVVVFPSLHEGFGLPLVEAMACGAPVAAAGGSSLVEVAGDAAAFFDPRSTASIAACLAQMVDAPEERAQRARLGLSRAGHFTWRRCAEATLDVLERAATAPAEGGRT